MAVTDDARNHLFETLSRQYEPEDARTLITMLGSSSSIEDLATKADIDGLRVELREVLYQQTRTQVTWMFGLLGAYTAMAGLLVAIGAVIITV